MNSSEYICIICGWDREDCQCVEELKIGAEIRLEYLRKQINNENISYGELLELQALSEYIKQDDVVLLEWAGIPEK